MYSTTHLHFKNRDYSRLSESFTVTPNRTLTQGPTKTQVGRHVEGKKQDDGE